MTFKNFLRRKTVQYQKFHHASFNPKGMQENHDDESDSKGKFCFTIQGHV